MLQSLGHPLLVLPAGSEALLRRIQEAEDAPELGLKHHPVLVLPAGSEALLRRIQIFHISNGRVVRVGDLALPL